MKIKICPICGEGLTQDQFLSVVTPQVKCLNNSGNFSIFEDFFENQILFHRDCLVKKCPEIDFSANFKNSTVQINDNVVSKCYEIIKSFGEEVTENDIVKLLTEQSCCNISKDEIVRLWFQHKK